MDNSILWTVIIAKKNTSLNIIRALDSINSQIYSPIKVMVIDANEPNSIYSLGLQEDLANYPDIDYISMDYSSSNAEIRNNILEQVEGEYITFIGSNEVLDSTKVLLQIEQLKRDPRAAASCSNGLLIDKRSANIKVQPLIEQVSYNPSSWALNNPAKMSAQVIYRIKAIKEAGGFDSQFSNYIDGDMLIRLSKQKKILILPISLCQCTIAHDDEDYDLNNFRDYQKIYRKHIELFIVNKHNTLEYYGRMINLAKKNYLWLNYILYTLMYLTKAPAKTILLILTEIGKLIKYSIKWIYRLLDLSKEYIRIKQNIQLAKLGRIKNIKVSTPPTAEIEIEKNPMIFSSFNEYNKLNSLDLSLNRKVKSIIIPDYVTIIKKYMFYGCEQLESIVIPNTVVEISAHAFHGCKNLRQITFQEGSRLVSIGPYAFAGCRALKSLTMSSNLADIGKGAFLECSALKEIHFTNIYRGEKRKSSIMPDTVTKLSKYAFAGCSKLSIIEFDIGSMLESIEDGAFLGCTELKKVFITGDIISLGNYAFAYCKNLKTAAFTGIDGIKNIGRSAFMHCEALEYFQIPNHIEHIYKRTFYGCSSLKLIKIPKKVMSINYQAFGKCTLLAKVIIYTRDITISPKAFEKYAEIHIQGPMD